MRLLCIFLIFFSLTACKTVKRSQLSETSVSSNSSQTEQKSDSSIYELTEVRQSIVGVPERKINAELKGDALKPVYNDKGIALPNTTTFKGNGVSITATAKPDGSIGLNANCDSMTLINEGLRRELKMKANNSQKAEKVEVVKYVKIFEKSKVKSGFNWTTFSLGAASSAAVIWLLEKLGFVKIIFSAVKKIIGNA